MNVALGPVYHVLADSYSAPTDAFHINIVLFGLKAVNLRLLPPLRDLRAHVQFRYRNIIKFSLVLPCDGISLTPPCAGNSLSSDTSRRCQFEFCCYGNNNWQFNCHFLHTPF